MKLSPYYCNICRRQLSTTFRRDGIDEVLDNHALSIDYSPPRIVDSPEKAPAHVCLSCAEMVFLALEKVPNEVRQWTRKTSACP